MKKIFYLIGFLFLPLVTQGAFGSVVINEIAWMGTENSYNDEWIELYNNSSFDLELKGWGLLSKDGTPEIILENKIPSKGFFILERTDDTTLPEIKADLIYKGSLNNKGEHLKLINNKGEIIDEVDCSSGWFTGDNSTKQTMERKSPLLSGNNPENWQTSQNPGGTPKTENKKQSPLLADGAASELGGKQKTTEVELPLTENKKELAAIGLPAQIFKENLGEQTLPESFKNPFWIFLIASGIAISSGIIVFFSKKMLKNKIL